MCHEKKNIAISEWKTKAYYKAACRWTSFKRKDKATCTFRWNYYSIFLCYYLVNEMFFFFFEKRLWLTKCYSVSSAHHDHLVSVYDTWSSFFGVFSVVGVTCRQGKGRERSSRRSLLHDVKYTSKYSDYDLWMHDDVYYLYVYNHMGHEYCSCIPLLQFHYFV